MAAIPITTGAKKAKANQKALIAQLKPRIYSWQRLIPSYGSRRHVRISPSIPSKIQLIQGKAGLGCWLEVFQNSAKRSSGMSTLDGVCGTAEGSGKLGAWRLLPVDAGGSGSEVGWGAGVWIHQRNHSCTSSLNNSALETWTPVAIPILKLGY
eukprot:scaffold22559_cov111-Cylindrotheca_fusiformis.AAC.27